MDSTVGVAQINDTIGASVVTNTTTTQQLNGNTSPTLVQRENNNNTLNDSLTGDSNTNSITNKKVKLENNNNNGTQQQIVHNNTSIAHGLVTQTNGPNNASNNVSTNGQNSNNASTRGSRVVHVRNIPADTSEADLVTLALPFGRVTNCLVLRGKSQAFVEFDSNVSAQQMVSYWSQTTIGGVATTLQPTIRGRNVFCQLSNHKELKVNQHMNETNNQSLMCSQSSQSLHRNDNQNDMSMIRGVIGGVGDVRSIDGGIGSSSSSSGVSCVLRVVVENLVYPVSLEVLHSVFSRAGKVAKIVTFTKNGSFQALIQFHDSNGALNAKHALDGQCLFHSANTLRIEFSKLQQLNVKYNNDKSRDYTNPSLPSIGQYGGGGGAGGGQSSDTQLLSEQSLMSSLIAAQNHLGGHGGGGGGGQPHHHMTTGHHSAIFASPFALSSTTSALRAIAASGPLHHALSAAMSATSVLLVSNLNETAFTVM